MRKLPFIFFYLFLAHLNSSLSVSPLITNVVQPPYLPQLSCCNDPTDMKFPPVSAKHPKMSSLTSWHEKKPVSCWTLIFFVFSVGHWLWLSWPLIAWFSCSYIFAFHALNQNVFLISFFAWWIVACLEKKMTSIVRVFGPAQLLLTLCVLRASNLSQSIFEFKSPCGFPSREDRP